MQTTKERVISTIRSVESDILMKIQTMTGIDVVYADPFLVTLGDYDLDEQDATLLLKALFEKYSIPASDEMIWFYTDSTLHVLAYVIVCESPIIQFD